MWYNDIDKIFLINLPTRSDRLHTVTRELERHKIPFELFPATLHDPGAYGLFLTMVALLEKAQEQKLKSILVLEDDVYFEPLNFHGHLNNTFKELSQVKWDLFYLGANIVDPLHKVPGCNNLLQCNYMVATHAIVYNQSGISKCLTALKEVQKNGWTKFDPIDMVYARKILNKGGCFVSNPMFAYQRPGYSDIEKRDTDYKVLLYGRFCEQLKNIK